MRELTAEKNHRSVDVSVVIPVFNEEENIEPLVDELQAVLNKVGKTYEVLLIDDCSADDSFPVMKELRRTFQLLCFLQSQSQAGQ